MKNLAMWLGCGLMAFAIGCGADDTATKTTTPDPEAMKKQMDDMKSKTKQTGPGGETAAPTGDAPAADKPADDKPAGDKPAGDKPAGDKPADDKPADDKKDDKPADEKKDDKPADEKKE